MLKDRKIELLLVALAASAVIIHQSFADDGGDAGGTDSPSSWPGHLKPLGWNTPHLPIAERTTFPSPLEFFQNYVYHSIPVIFKDGAKRSPAFYKWTDEYLKNLPESQELIDVEQRKVEDRNVPVTSMSFAEFLERYKIYDEYLVTGVPHFLKKDVLIPPSLHCDNITANFLFAIMWFSSGGTKSVLHNDDVDNLNCLFSGQKEILFINYTKHRHQMKFDHPEGSYFGVNVEKVDFTEYPELKDVEFFEAKMEAGDCIFIPYKWYHQVNSIDRNIAVNIWWNHNANIIPIPSTCGTPSPGLSLADVKFRSEEIEEGNEEAIGYPELEFFENPVKDVAAYMEEKGVVLLEEDDLVGFLSEKMPTLRGIWNKEALEIGSEIFKLMDEDKDGKITSEDMETLMNQKDDEFFSLHLQQQFVMLIDVVDEEIVKQRRKLLRKLNKNKTEENSKTVPQDNLKMSGRTSEPSKDEL